MWFCTTSIVTDDETMFWLHVTAYQPNEAVSHSMSEIRVSMLTSDLHSHYRRLSVK